jgi:DHA2 family multidrug resistance protein
MTGGPVMRPDRPAAATWAGFLLMCLGMFMAILDIQVVATSLPTIQDALAISPDAMSWIQTAYLIAEVIAIPLTGLFTRVLTLRWLFVVAVSVFTLASIGCAYSGDFTVLLAFRVLQGFSGGVLIPAVFSAVFLLFPPRLHAVATTIGGVIAVLAPTVGPVVGGWITDNWSWPWLFLINVVPGIVASTVTPFLLPRQDAHLEELSTLDGVSSILLAAALACLEIGLKEAPVRGWLSPTCIALLAASAICLTAMTRRTLLSAHPIVRLSLLKRRSFAFGCGLSFCLGVGLFGSVYLMPVFLAFVRRHDAFEIGSIMLVTGVSQLLAAPLAVMLENRIGARYLTAFGFALFAVGLGMSAFQPRVADFNQMFWPQVVRGFAIMFCLLPPTRIALGALEEAEVPDASGLFNLMRNLGGAIGIALIDTVIYTRAPEYAQRIINRLMAGDLDTAKAVGIPPEALATAPLDPEKQALLASLVDRVAFVDAINDAWALVAVMTFVALFFLPLARRVPTPPGAAPH